MEKENSVLEAREERAITNTRIFDCHPETMFKAWSDPNFLCQWWGPKGFTSTFNTFDFRPGGLWDFVMHGPNGVDYHNKSVFVEIKPLEKIVFDHLEPVHEFRLTATFSKEEGSTRLTFRMQFTSAEERNRIRSFVSAANEENLDRLEQCIKRMQTKWE